METNEKVTTIVLSCMNVGWDGVGPPFFADDPEVKDAVDELLALMGDGEPVADVEVCERRWPDGAWGEPKVRGRFAKVSIRSEAREQLENMALGLHPLYLHPARERDHRDWRTELRWFASRMEARLRANDHKPSWKRESPYHLFARLLEEVGELAMRLNEDPQHADEEAVDVANFAMMIADVTTLDDPTDAILGSEAEDE